MKALRIRIDKDENLLVRNFNKQFEEEINNILITSTLLNYSYYLETISELKTTMIFFRKFSTQESKQPDFLLYFDFDEDFIIFEFGAEFYNKTTKRVSMELDDDSKLENIQKIFNKIKVLIQM